MAKVIFTVQYEIKPARKDEYLSIMRELKTLVAYEGLQNYSVYEVKGKETIFEESYTFISVEAYENFDDSQNERINILMEKLSEIILKNSSKYSTKIAVIE